MKKNIKDYQEALGDWRKRNPLRKRRKVLGFSQAFVGEIVGKGHHRVSDWEQGASFPSDKTVRELAELLGPARFRKDWEEWVKCKPALL